MSRGPVIIKIGGVTLERQAESGGLWRALLAMHTTRLAAGHGGVVLVHGGGKAVDRLLARLGIVSERRDGIRITSAEEIGIVTAVLAGSVNKSLVGCINREALAAGSETRAAGLCLGDAGLCRVVKSTRFAFDPGFVGEVVSGDARLITALFSAGVLPVLSSIGLDDAGHTMNINADDAAAALAAVLHAESLVLLTDVPGVKNARGQIVPELSRDGVETMIASGEISGGMIPKARAAIDTSARSGAAVTIMSGDAPEDLERWSRGEPVGTRLSAATHSSTR